MKLHALFITTKERGGKDSANLLSENGDCLSSFFLSVIRVRWPITERGDDGFVRIAYTFFSFFGPSLII